MTHVSISNAFDLAARAGIASRSSLAALRIAVIAAGIGASILFVVIALGFELQLYADGSIFSYSVAVADAWAFHWHNISGRLLVFLYTLLPAETYVALTGDARGGIALYGLLFYSAQLLGLAATFAADRSKGRILFAYACLSTACLCPLVFGFPTEMWLAHALFWPALALCHYARRGIAGTAMIFAALLALVLTHEGAVVFAVAIVATVLLRGPRDPPFLRSGGVLAVVMAIWAAVKLALPPDGYFAGVLAQAAWNFIVVSALLSPMSLSLAGALADYGVIFVVLRRFAPRNAGRHAATIVATALGIYWLWFDDALNAADRYSMRTALLIATPSLGGLAVLYALRAEGRPPLPGAIAPRLMAMLAGEASAQAALGALFLVLLVHTVETAKFVAAWSEYKAAVRTLAIGTASDPALGDTRFVSANRIRRDVNRLSWRSTTQFLSVLLAPGFAPARLVVDPSERYFWFTCTVADESQEADRPVPVVARQLIRLHTCLHR